VNARFAAAKVAFSSVPSQNGFVLEWQHQDFIPRWRSPQSCRLLPFLLPNEAARIITEPRQPTRRSVYFNSIPALISTNEHESI
jgi:hypothetical protein